MSKLKRLSLIFVLVALAMSILSISTLNTFFILGGIVIFSLALFYTYLNKARKTFKKDVLENLK